MRISDWSSDVCSSDLTARCPFLGLGGAQFGGGLDQRRIGTEGTQRRLVTRIDHRLCDADEFAGARFILARERQTVAGCQCRRELVANLEREIGSDKLAPILGCEELGIC